ncbi:glycosyltransferase family 4 protein [Bacillus sp. JJ1566]|uniref:glycosyltransferase family 4 protein n=1 Tax=Bacillus sp. JJ1566 TaxID=3122961 RepID=UPI003000BD54
MKILLATFWPLPMVGGVWSYVQALYQALTNMDYEVDILSHHPNEKKYHIINDGRSINKALITNSVQKIIQPFFKSSHPDMYFIAKYETERYGFEAAAAYFDLKKYDLIHTQDVISARALSRVKPKETPLISTLHGCYTFEYIRHVKKAVTESELQKWKQTFISRYFATTEHYGANASNVTIVPTQWLKNLLKNEFNIPKEKFKVVPYGIDIKDFIKKMEVQTEKPPPAANIIIGCPARLDRVKGHQFLLEALAKLKHQRNDWICWFIGNGSLLKELKNYARNLGIEEHIVFLGNRNDVPALLKNLDLIVLPSLQDNHPFALMEAQIAGKPIVTTDAGGIPEMVTHDKTGLICPKGDSDILYQNIKRVIENKTLSNRLSAAAKEQAMHNWPIDRMINRTLAIYRQFTEDGQHGEKEE